MLECCTFQTSRLHVSNWLGGGRADLDRAELALKLLTDEVTEWLPPDWHKIDSIERAKSWIDDLERDDGTVLIAKESSNNAFVGILILSTMRQIESENTHIGYLILQSRQGEGFATELVKGFVDWASSRPEIESIFAGVAEAHIASRAVLEKSGFSLINSDDQSGSDLTYQIALQH